MQQLGVDAAVLCGFLGLSWKLLAPPAINGGALFHMGIGGDPALFIWSLNWWTFASSHHLPLLRTNYVSWPTGIALTWRTTIPALSLLTLPIIHRFGAVTAYNVLMVCAPGLSGWGAYLAARELAGRIAPAIFSGLIFGFSPYEMGHLQAGHINLDFTLAVPLCAWVLLRAAKRRWPAARLAVSLGLLLAFEFGVSQEIFASLVVFGIGGFIALYVCHVPLRPVLDRLAPGMAMGLLLAAVIISPLVWQMLISSGTGDHETPPPDRYSNDMLAFFIPTPITLLGGWRFIAVTRHFTGNYAEQGAYFGLPLLALLGIAYRDGAAPDALRILLVAALAAAVLSLGPYAHIAGQVVSSAPWNLVTRLPFLKAMLPGRFIMYAWAAVSLAVAVWLARPGKAWWRYAALCGAMACCFPCLPIDCVWTNIAVPAVFLPAGQADYIKPGSNILILPYLGDETAYQYASGMNFHMVAQGYLGGGIPAPFSRWPLLLPLYGNRFDEIDPREFSVFLAAYGTDAVVVLNDRLQNPQEAAAVLAKAGWLRGEAGAGFAVYHAGPAASVAPSQAVILAYENTRNMAVLRRRETIDLCAVETIERAFGLRRDFAFAAYMRFGPAPVPPAEIMCR